MREEGRHGIGELSELDGPKEHSTTCTLVVVELHFGLKSKIKKKGLGEVEDVVSVRPSWDADRDGWVEARDGELQHTPDIIVPVV